jgi:hypothetical protein
MKKLLFSVILVMFIAGVTYSQELLWSHSENVNDLFVGDFVKTDDSNNVYVGARGTGKMYLIKYDQAGTMQFISGDDNTSSFNGMVVNNEGRSFLAGSNYQTSTKKDGLLHVYEPGGSIFYTQQYNFIGEADEFWDIFVDASGNAYVTGEANDAVDRYALTIKYSPSGAPQWVQRYGSILNKYMGMKVNVNASGEVFVTGVFLNNTTQNIDIFVIKYGADGTLISEFETNIEGYRECIPSFALLDDNDNLFIGGTLNTIAPDFVGFVIKVTDGNLIWTKTFPSPNDYVLIYDGALDAEGNVIIGGIYKDVNTDAYYAKISPTGGLIYEKFYNGPGDENDGFSKLTIKGEYTYLCGASFGIGTFADYVILKVNAAGEQMWEAHYNGFVSGEDIAYDIVLDNEDNVIVTGTSAETGGMHCTTVKFSNPLGIEEDDMLIAKTPGIYPNPASVFLHIDYVADSDDAEYSISDFSGRIICSGILNNSPIQKIDISDFSSGIYLLSIEDGSQHFNAKFVKN